MVAAPKACIDMVKGQQGHANPTILYAQEFRIRQRHGIHSTLEEGEPSTCQISRAKNLQQHSTLSSYGIQCLIVINNYNIKVMNQFPLRCSWTFVST